MTDFFEAFLGDFPHGRRIRDLRALLDQRSQDIEQLTSKISALHGDLVKLSNDQATTETALADARAARAAGQQVEESLRDEIKKSLDVIKAANDRLARKDDEQRNERGVWTASESKLRARIDELIEKRKFDNDAAAAARTDAEHLRLAIAKAEKDREAAAAGEQNLREKIEQLIERRDQIKSVVQETSAALEQMKSALTLAQAELRNERDQHAKDQAALRAGKHEAEEQRSETKKLLQQAQHALTEARKSARDLTAALDREISERSRLAAELSRDPTRLRLAQAEESIHVHLARALEQAEPADSTAARHSNALYAKLERRTLEAASAAGGVAVARARKAPGVRAMTPEAFGAHLTAQPQAWALAVDESAPCLAALRMHAQGAPVMKLSEAVLRHAAGVALPPTIDTSTPHEPVKRALLIISEDDATSDLILKTLEAISGMRTAPAIPAALLARADADQLSFDDWLNTVLEGGSRAKFLALRMDAETLAAVRRQADRGRCPAMEALLRGARVMHLVWSDKCLGAAHRQLRGMAANLALDDGDARMSLPLYRDAVARDLGLERIALTGRLLRPGEIVKTYVELTNEFSLSDFCRDAGFAVKPARIADEVDAFAALSDPRAIAFAKRIRAAAETRARMDQPTARAASHVTLARALERAGRYAEAQRAYEDAMNTAPEDAAARIGAARYRELSDRPDEAEALLRKGLNSCDSRLEIITELRELYRRTGDIRRQVALARLARRDDAPNAMLDLATAVLKAGDTDAAAKAVSALKSMPKPPPLGAVPAFVSLRQALPALRDAAADGNAQALFALAEALRQLDEPELALKAYQQAIAADAEILARAWREGAAPDFLVIGPPRTATTLLRNLLELHPAIGLLEGESAFLSNKRPLSIADFAEKIAAVGKRKGSARMLGDKSPQHFAIGEAHVALAAFLFPNARIIVTTRDPIVRAWSEIKHGGFECAMNANILATLAPDARPPWLEEMLDHSRYQTHLQKWVRHFGAERVLIIQSEDLESDVVCAAQHIFEWLGVTAPPRSEIEQLQEHWSNRTAGYALSPALDELLRAGCGAEAYKPEELRRAITRQACSA